MGVLEEIKKEIKKTFYIDEDDMQCQDTNLKIKLDDLEYVNDLRAYKEVYEKGIDELIKKYEEEKELIWHDIMCNKKDTPTYNRLSGELTQVNQMLEDLKKLKGSE